MVISGPPTRGALEAARLKPQRFPHQTLQWSLAGLNWADFAICPRSRQGRAAAS